MNKLRLFLFLLFSFIFFSCGEKSEPEKQIVLNKYGINVDTLLENTGIVQKNETLGEIFESYGINYQTAINLARVSRDTFYVRDIKPGHIFAFYFTDDSLRQLKNFVYEIDKVNFVIYDFNDSVSVRTGKKPVKIIERKISGIINNSLWQTMHNLDVNPSLAIELSEIFAWQINFYGIQKEDKFKVIFKESSVEDKFIGFNEISVAEFIHRGKTYNAVRFEQDGVIEYFDTSGLSLRKQFLKAPLKFSRISSHYSPNRLHPVLKYRRPHLGVDFAAPRGTPVRTIGDGDVIFVGRQNQEGNYVKIRHNGTYSSGYMHLSKFEKGIVIGKHVRQGEIIGYVGSTGLSSGPHLDLRFWKNGQPVNYLTQEFPPTYPVKEENKKKFAGVVKKVINDLNSITYED